MRGEHITHDGEGWVFHSKYEDEKTLHKVIEHFRAGLLLTSLHGALGVSRNTIKNWRKQYEEFDQAIEVGVGALALYTDNKHLEASTGEFDGNIHVLNKRAEKVLNLVAHSAQLEEIEDVLQELKNTKSALVKERKALAEQKERLQVNSQ